MCAVKLGSGPILPLFKVRIWTKMIFAYFYSGFRPFLFRNYCFVNLGVCNLLLTTFQKITFFEYFEKMGFQKKKVWENNMTKCFWNQQNTIKWGGSRDFWVFVSIKTQTCKKKKQKRAGKMKIGKMFPKVCPDRFGPKLFEVCQNAYFTMFSRVFGLKTFSARSKRPFL